MTRPAKDASRSEDRANTDRRRILEAARSHFFSQGFGAVTMDQLAAELGMSKKTLYQHFPSKDALLETVIDQFAEGASAMLGRIFGDTRASTPDKLRAALAGIGEHLTPIQPAFLASLRRFAPQQYQRIQALRRQNLTAHLVPLLTTGRKRGELRGDSDPAFMVELLLQALHGLLEPDTLHRLGRTPSQAVSEALDVLFHGILRTKP
ncbi:MAG: TetR/AcrR family transcriptional regulator [Verrucomicrobiales bacterium]|nr:TetR/AcrR family transcriptional regulator [Verrucomicrobiales bacterium]